MVQDKILRRRDHERREPNSVLARYGGLSFRGFDGCLFRLARNFLSALCAATTSASRRTWCIGTSLEIWDVEAGGDATALHSHRVEPGDDEVRAPSRLLQKFRPEHEALHLLRVALHLVRVAGEADVLHECAALDRFRGAFDLEVLDERDAVAVFQFVAVRVARDVFGHAVSRVLLPRVVRPSHLSSGGWRGQGLRAVMR